MAIDPVWAFEEQPDKYGYVNNPRWTSLEAAKGFCVTMGLPINPKTHTPCGHWHRTEPEDDLEVT